MTLLTWIAAFAAGLLASLGVGGGMVLIIWLTAVLGTAQLEAQGINLIFFLPIALLSVILHKKNGLISIKAMLPAMICGVIGSAAGALAAHATAPQQLKRIFAVFIFIVGIKELVSALRNRRKPSDG